MNIINNIAPLFGVGDICNITEINKGHINRTFLADSGDEGYVIQLLSAEICRSPEIIWENIAAIEKAAAAFPDCGIAIPEYLRANGRGYVEYNGGIWRMYRYIEADAAYSPYMHGFSVGRFLRVINSADITLKTAVKLHDFDFPLPMRNIHGDTKADNIIFGNIPTIIDFDTAMRGYAFVDFGDMLRSVTSNGFDMEKVRAAVSGFFEGVGDLLTKEEVSSLASGTRLIMTELMERYAGGCMSFPNKTPEHCRKRRCQLEVQLEEFHRHEDEIADYVLEIYTSVC